MGTARTVQFLAAMTFELGFALALSILLTVYLVYALIRPERF